MCQYDDGGKYCHRCHGWDNSSLVNTGETYEPKQQQRKPMETIGTMDQQVDLDFYYKAAIKGIPERRITADVCKKYGVRTNEQGHHLFPGYNEAGELVAVKTCVPKNGDIPKKFSIKGPWGSCVLFGAQAFPKTGLALTITEGEYDALAAYQATGSKYPNVSILNGCGGARKDFERNFEAIGSFNSVVINFDADKPGKEATDTVAPMFPGKTKVLQLVEGKDACDYLKANKMKKYVDEFHRSKSYTMGGVVNGRDTWEAYKKAKDVKSIPFPPEWSDLNAKSYGVRKGEIVLVTAGTGSGKTQWLRELKYYWLTETEEKIMDIGLEEDYTDSVGGLIALDMNKRIGLPDVTVDEVDEKKSFDKLFGEGKILFNDHEGNFGDASLIELIKEAVIVEKCGIIFLDHITIAVSDGAAGEENMTMDKFMNNLLKIAKQHKVTIVVVSHLRKTGGGGKSFEEGRIPCEDDLKGSGSLKQIAMTTVALSRNKYHENDKIRNTTSFHLLKCRFSGRSGPCDHAYFDDDTGRMVAVDPAVFFEDAANFDGTIGGSHGNEF